MKTVYLIGILVFLLVTVSSASAATFYLTETTDDYIYGVPIKVQVDYSGSTMSVTVIEPQNKAYDGYTISNINLKNVWIKTTPDKVSVSSPWVTSTGSTIGNFGNFGTQISKPNSQTYIRTSINNIQLADSVDTLIKNNGNYIVAAHVSFDKSGVPQTVDCSGKVTGSAQIPEFPSVALPVAAIIGIMFIFGRGRKS